MASDTREVVGEERLQRVRPGVYLDSRGTVHIDAPELLEAVGWQPTKLRLRFVRQMAEAIASQFGKHRAMEVHLDGIRHG